MLRKIVSYDGSTKAIGSISSGDCYYEVATVSDDGHLNFYDMDFNTLQKFLSLCPEKTYSVNRKWHSKAHKSARKRKEQDLLF